MSFKTAITQNTNSNLNINKDYFDDRKKNINKVKDKLKVVTLNWTKRNQEKKCIKNVVSEFEPKPMPKSHTHTSTYP